MLRGLLEVQCKRVCVCVYAVRYLTYDINLIQTAIKYLIESYEHFTEDNIFHVITKFSTHEDTLLCLLFNKTKH